MCKNGKRTLLLALWMLLGASCGGDQVVAEGDGGAQIDGTILACGPGTHAVQGQCVPDERPEGCGDTDCGPHGTCRINSSGLPYCDCEEGYRSKDGSCTPTCNASLQKVGFLPGESFPYGTYDPGVMAFDGDLLYLTTRDAVYPVDVSDPAAPRIVGSAETGLDVLSTALHVGRFMIVSGTELSDPHDSGRLAVYDLSDPAQPTKVNELHEYATSMATNGTTLFLSNGEVLRAFDVGSLPDLREVGRLETGPNSEFWEYLDNLFAHPDGQHVMATGGRGPWSLVDVTDLENMQIGAFGDDSYRGVFGLGLAGTILFGYDYLNRLWLIDVSLPMQPRTVGAFSIFELRVNGDPPPTGKEWDVAKLDDDHVAVASRSKVHILDIADPAHPVDVASGGPPDDAAAITRGHVAARDDGLVAVSFWSFNSSPDVSGLWILRFSCD